MDNKPQDNFIYDSFPVGMELSLSVTITDKEAPMTLIGIVNDHKPSVETGMLKGLQLNAIGFFDIPKLHEIKHKLMLEMIDSGQNDPYKTLEDLKSLLIEMLNGSHTKAVDTRVTGST